MNNSHMDYCVVPFSADYIDKVIEYEKQLRIEEPDIQIIALIITIRPMKNTPPNMLKARIIATIQSQRILLIDFKLNMTKKRLLFISMN